MSKYIFILKILLLSVFMITASGCLVLPHTTEVAPAVRGQIVDESSGNGICGAKITYTIKAENQYSKFAISDKNGKRWYIFL